MVEPGLAMLPWGHAWAQVAIGVAYHGIGRVVYGQRAATTRTRDSRQTGPKEVVVGRTGACFGVEGRETCPEAKGGHNSTLDSGFAAAAIAIAAGC